MSSPHNRRLAGLASAVLMITALAGPAAAVEYDPELVPGGTFLDDDGLYAEGAIEAIAGAGITQGCATDRFCPDQAVTRGELATFLARSLGLDISAVDAFTDDQGNPHEPAINALAAAGRVGACETGLDRFCPDRPATRAETAAILVGAFEYPPTTVDAFADDTGLPYEPQINRLAAAGITSGCDEGLYCPNDTLTRGQIAMLLVRALSLQPRFPQPRPQPEPQYPAVGEGKRIIYSNSGQRVWLIDENEQLVDTYLVSGKEGVPAAGTYGVYSKSVLAYSYNGITMAHMVRFAPAPRTNYGFHAIPLDRYGNPMQTVEELGQFRSGGCVRQSIDKAAFLYEWTPIGTTVIVLP